MSDNVNIWEQFILKFSELKFQNIECTKPKNSCSIYYLAVEKWNNVFVMQFLQ